MNTNLAYEIPHLSKKIPYIHEIPYDTIRLRVCKEKQILRRIIIIIIIIIFFMNMETTTNFKVV
jgi:hypothetical protein